MRFSLEHLSTQVIWKCYTKLCKTVSISQAFSLFPKMRSQVISGGLLFQSKPSSDIDAEIQARLSKEEKAEKRKERRKK